MLIVVFIFIVLMLLARFFLGFAVFYDAKSRKNNHPLIWALLCGFFGFIPVIVYFNLKSVCPRCHSKVARGAQMCYTCASPIMPEASQQDDSFRYQKRARRFWWLAIVFYDIFVSLFAYMVIWNIIKYGF